MENRHFLSSVLPANLKAGCCYMILLIALTSCISGPSESNHANASDKYIGSISCRECHERFYNLWASSHHGTAMQPITANFIKTLAELNQEAVNMEGASYKAVAKDTLLFIREQKDGVLLDYQVLWALGGKNVFYFLAAWEGGRLQTLPLAYDVQTKKWYNNPQSAIRHFPNMNQGGMQDSALSWRDRQYTFNTSCYGCHVSQLKNNFDLTTNKYQTDWKEAGINCETCHGPCAEHISVCKKAGKGNVPKDLKIIITKTFTPEQHNSSCTSCHAKMRPITASYPPGDRYFDNFDLITLESPDFYPDGRDLGENYTMTGWYMNSCQQNSKLHCVTCHTSSGRYRYKNDDRTAANKACTSCHADIEKFDEKHTHHAANKSSPKCVDCHMPTTRFGNMTRSDHSFRPPMPAASIKFKSPNACNICHNDQSAEWANRQVTQWIRSDYQRETLFIGGLIEEARLGKWGRLDEMLKVIQTNKHGEVFTNSLIRLLGNCDNPKKWPVLKGALKLESPLSRSSAVLGLLGYRNEVAKNALFVAAKDEFRLVRLAAAQSLASFQQQDFNPEQLLLFQKVNVEYENSLVSRPDDWSAYYNLGNHYQNMGQTPEALSAYNNSLKIYPDAIMPLINSSFLYSVSGEQAKAETNLKKALSIDPLNEAANLNLGLLAAEMQKMDEAEGAFRTVLKVNAGNSTAAYNLSIIVSPTNLSESCILSKQAMNASPNDPKFAYTYAYFMIQNKKKNEAMALLEKTIKKFPDHLSSVFLLGNTYLENGKPEKAIVLYTKTIRSVTNDQQAINQLENEILRVKSR